jgi:hypothetical protein
VFSGGFDGMAAPPLVEPGSRRHYSRPGTAGSGLLQQRGRGAGEQRSKKPLVGSYVRTFEGSVRGKRGRAK